MPQCAAPRCTYTLRRDGFQPVQPIYNLREQSIALLHRCRGRGLALLVYHQVKHSAREVSGSASMVSASMPLLVPSLSRSPTFMPSFKSVTRS